VVDDDVCEGEKRNMPLSVMARGRRQRRK
jgi:hypothetical protein